MDTPQEPEQVIVHQKKALIKDIKTISRNDGNMVAVTLHYEYTNKDAAKLITLFDRDVHVTIGLFQYEFEPDVHETEPELFEEDEEADEFGPVKVGEE